MKKTYSIIRMYRDDKPSRIVRRGLTKAQAQAHCRKDDTHSVDREGFVNWFDDWTEDDK